MAAMGREEKDRRRALRIKVCLHAGMLLVRLTFGDATQRFGLNLRNTPSIYHIKPGTRIMKWWMLRLLEGGIQHDGGGGVGGVQGKSGRCTSCWCCFV